jgi:hypothetical protein
MLIAPRWQVTNYQVFVSCPIVNKQNWLSIITLMDSRLDFLSDFIVAAISPGVSRFARLPSARRRPDN